MNLKKTISALLSSAMVFSIGSMSASAADASALENGTYTANVSILKNATQDASMSDGVFAPKADITISGDTATIKAYVINPVPGVPQFFADRVTEGVVGNVVASYNGTEYPATVDFTSKPEKIYTKHFPVAKIELGKAYPSDVVTFELPKAVLNETHIDIALRVNLMNQDHKLDLVLSDITTVGTSQQPTSEAKNVQLTATVAATQTTYSVTIPKAVAFGTLSATEDTIKTVDIAVDMVAGADASKVRVSSEQNGELSFGENKIAFTNDFGTKDFANSEAKTATLTVAKENVKDKAVGDYTGTTIFAISTVK